MPRTKQGPRVGSNTLDISRFAKQRQEVKTPVLKLRSDRGQSDFSTLDCSRTLKTRNGQARETL